SGSWRRRSAGRTPATRGRRWSRQGGHRRVRAVLGRVDDLHRRERRHAGRRAVSASGGSTMSLGYNQPLYILPFDHRGSFQTGLFGWKGTLDAAQAARVAAAKQVVYEGFKAALAGGVPKDRAGILVDEQFGAAILADAAKAGITTAAPAEKSGQAE